MEISVVLANDESVFFCNIPIRFTFKGTSKLKRVSHLYPLFLCLFTSNNTTIRISHA